MSSLFFLTFLVDVLTFLQTYAMIQRADTVGVFQIESRAQMTMVPRLRPEKGADYASTGLTLGRHPIALLRPVLRRRRAITARELHVLPHGTRTRAGGLESKSRDFC